MMKIRLMAWCMALVLILGMVMVPVETAKAASTTATVKGGWLRLRAEASFDAETISSYFTGTVVTVQGSIGKWYRVTAPDGRTGYMYSDYLTINQQGSGSVSPQPKLSPRDPQVHQGVCCGPRECK